MTIDPTAGALAAHGVAFAPDITAAARRHGLDPGLLAAVAAQETGGPGSNAGRNVVGDGGHGHGLFQIDDRYHDFASTPAAMDPGSNADYAAGMLSGLLGKYGGNVHEALSAYNAGDPSAAGTPTTWGDGKTLDYADSVLRHYGQITGGSADPEQSGDAGLTESAIAEMPSLLASIGSLGGAAASMPSLPQAQQPQSYHRAATDYSGLFDDGDDA